MKNENLKRCAWAEGHELNRIYHDTEWGTPLHDDRRLFEFLILEGMQAGLSWLTILKKRENFRRAFDNFDPVKIARYRPAKINKLLQDEGIIRNRLKIEAAVKNAAAYLQIVREHGSFESFIWQFVGGRPIINRWKKLNEIPTSTVQAKDMSKALKAYGCNFVGPTICYAFMQATGMVNDHEIGCFRHSEVQKH